MSYVPDQARSVYVRGQFYRRSSLDPTLWERESSEEESGGLLATLTTKVLRGFGGTASFYDRRGEKLL